MINTTYTYVRSNFYAIFSPEAKRKIEKSQAEIQQRLELERQAKEAAKRAKQEEERQARLEADRMERLKFLGSFFVVYSDLLNFENDPFQSVKKNAKLQRNVNG